MPLILLPNAASPIGRDTSRASCLAVPTSPRRSRRHFSPSHPHPQHIAIHPFLISTQKVLPQPVCSFQSLRLRLKVEVSANNILLSICALLLGRLPLKPTIPALRVAACGRSDRATNRHLSTSND